VLFLIYSVFAKMEFAIPICTIANDFTKSTQLLGGRLQLHNYHGVTLLCNLST